MCFKEMFFALCCAADVGQVMDQQLPDYITPDNPILHQAAETLQFPLSVQDKADIATLSAKFDIEKDCAGLAAPQIGISKAIIVFAVADDPQLKKFRTDLIQTMPKTIWINPSYTPIDLDKRSDWEACFSIPEIAGLVERFCTIKYSAYDENGTPIAGVAKGFLARIIQHEIDHLHGVLFKDKASETISKTDYIAMRKQMMV